MSQAIQMLFDFTEDDTEHSYGPWMLTNKGDQSCRILADHHYSRQTIGAKLFTRPGENIVLRTADGTALWVSWRSKFNRKDGYGSAWECTHFRSEAQDKYLSSDLIKYAMYATTQIWGEIPSDGFITYIDETKVHSSNAGFCYEKAGFVKQKRKSTRGLLCYKTEQHLLNLVLEEMGEVRYLEFCQEQMNQAILCGEFMEAEDFQQNAEDQLRILTSLKDKMKSMKLKAWSHFEQPWTNEELQAITSPYDNWIFDEEYLLRKGLVLDSE